MIKVNSALLFLLLLSILAVPSYAELDQEKTYERAYIEWKPAEGALSYTVEIMDIYDDLILRKTTESLKLEVSLPYGNINTASACLPNSIKYPAGPNGAPS